MLGTKKSQRDEQKSSGRAGNSSSGSEGTFNKRESQGYRKRAKNSDKSSNSGSSQSKRYFLRSNKGDDISMNAYDEVQALYVESAKDSSSGKEGSTEKKSSIQSTKDSKDTVAPHERRFQTMSTVQKKKCFNNLAKEIKVMRRKFTRYNKSIQRKEIQSQAIQEDEEFLKTCHAAQQVINSENFELPDSQLLLQNLSKVIIDGTLSLDSLEFFLMCTLVRKVLRKERNKNAKVPLTMKEHLFFNSSSKEEIVSFFTGAPKTMAFDPQPLSFTPQPVTAPILPSQPCQIIPVAIMQGGDQPFQYAFQQMPYQSYPQMPVIYGQAPPNAPK